MRPLFAALATLLTLACSDRAPTEPGSQTLTGHWISQRFSLGGSASYEHHLTLSLHSRFVSEARHFGSYRARGRMNFPATIVWKGPTASIATGCISIRCDWSGGTCS